MCVRQVLLANQEKKDVYPFSFMVLIFLAAVIVSSIAKQHTNSNAAWGTGACTIALIVAAKARWDLNGRWWFGLLYVWERRYNYHSYSSCRGLRLI
ncbi:hypothetical protein HDF12_001925 [Edaphobacter lichenicola]|uniref:Uncharacterized protein n=2 Tax=Tunturiibacter TaxID=3154218 RepID=A0A7Y9NML4_9BACT|nr:hypothetical protein [Edaphobacter lichenicola]NYF51560.1 hypothetical protein [Edaphobacter lichenicola]